MDSDVAKKLLFNVADVLEACGIVYFLDFGTLLGAVRGGDFIEYDNDIDLGVFDNVAGDYSLLYKLASELSRKGVRLNSIWEHSAVSFTYEGISLDLNRYVKCCDGWRISLEGKKCYYPPKFLDTLDTISFRGRIFNTPSKPKDLLELGYGDTWGTPIEHKKPNGLFRDDPNQDCLVVQLLVPIFDRKEQ